MLIKGLSKYTHVRSEVPQGTKLGSVLIHLFINDLPSVLKYCKAYLDADDVTLHIHIINIHTIEYNIQSEFFNNASKQWSKITNILNQCKTSSLVVGTSTHHLDIKATDVSFRHVSNQKLLGVYIDENFNWSTHIEYVCKTVSSQNSLLCQLSEYVQIHMKKQFF